MIRTLTLASVTALLGILVACGSTGVGGSTAAPACTTLAACCAAAGAEQGLCVAIVTSNVPTSCSSELVSLQTSGTCATAPGTGTGTGTATNPGSGCTALAACCELMTGAAATACITVVGEAVPAACTTELTSYEKAGACGKTGTGPGTGTGTGSDTACTLLAECCAQMPPGSSATACEEVVAMGLSSSCSSELSAYESTDACGGIGPGTGTGTGTGNHTGTTTQTGTNTGTISSSTSTGPVCTPHALPTNFQFRSIGLESGACTSVQDEGINTCLSMGTSCSTYDTGTCGTCVFNSFTNNSWGPFAFITASGAGAVQLPFYNTAGCVLKVNPTATACATAINQAFECEIEACLAYCPVASSTDTTGEDALLGTSTTTGCLGDADTGVCASYISAENTECAAFQTDAGAEGRCDALMGATDVGPYIALFCGGEDAGI